MKRELSGNEPGVETPAMKKGHSILKTVTTGDTIFRGWEEVESEGRMGGGEA
jgi:hypothetical protein